MNLELKNKTALVTGKGIGKAIAMAFAEEGANVVIHVDSSQGKGTIFTISFPPTLIVNKL
ncbi:hypothetical protein [Niallia oryzisoli]|uniref:hypothetical protein n=1 Tax=Niallia oryzisoli TaxID=1737571 RepID=UPI003BAE6FA3